MDRQKTGKTKQLWIWLFFLTVLLGSQEAWAKVYSVQLGVFQKYQNALRQSQLLKKSASADLSEHLRIEKTGKIYVVKVGRTEDLEQALNLLSSLKSYFPDAFVCQADSIPESVLKKENKPTLTADPPTRKEKSPSALERKENESAGKTPSNHQTNRTEVTGTLREISSIPSEQLGLPPGKTVYRLKIQVEKTKTINKPSDLLKERVGEPLTAFSETKPPFFEPGSKITAVVEYRGDRFSRFYWISKPQAAKP